MNKDLPDGWKWILLGDIAFEVSDRIDNPSESGLERFVGLEHMDSESLTVKRWGSTDDVTSAMKLFKKGDMLFARRNAYLKRASIATFEGVCSGDAIVLRQKNAEYVDGLLPLILNSEKLWEFAIANASGSMSKRVKWRDLATFEIPLPPKEEQRRIADILWAAEEYIVKNEKLVGESESYKKILMKELLTEGIGHTEFRDSEIGRIPKDWDVKTLVNAIGMKKDLIVAGPFGSNLKVEDYKDEGIPIIRLQNIEFCRFINKDIKYISPKKAEELNYHSFIEGDLVLAKLGDPIGKTCIIPNFLEKGIVVADVVRIRVNEQFSDKKYILYILNSFHVSNQLNRGMIGTTRPRVNLDQVRELLIPVPHLPEQRQIAEIFSKLDDTILKAQETINKTKELKKMLINQFFYGGLETAVSIIPQSKRVIYETQVNE